ncbi:MAG: hypothetical protein IH914_05585, partial [candidate division Zixibacteria bacterium]|nr:hypothetical protein [candidate division Zixibacteria bacterium]
MAGRIFTRVYPQFVLISALVLMPFQITYSQTYSKSYSKTSSASARLEYAALIAQRYAVGNERQGMYLGASSAKVLGCVTGSAPDAVRGLTVGCTFHDLQKHGSMGRQIAVSLQIPHINFTWTNQDNNSFFGGRNVRFESWNSVTGMFGDGTGGVDILGGLIPPD